MTDILKVAIEIAGRKYNVNIKEADKDVFEEAARMVNDTLTTYEQKYSYEDKQDLLALVLLQYTTSYIKMYRSKTRDSNDVFVSRLRQLNQVLTEITDKMEK